MTHTLAGWIVRLGLLTGCGGNSPGVPDALADQRDSVEAASSLKGASPAGPNAEQQAVNATGAATKQFLDRIQEYVAFHDGVEKTVPSLKETPNPEEIAAREKTLGAALIKARPNAKEGDFFVASYRPILTRIIRDDFAKRAPADRKALLVELPKGVSVAINQIYPTTLPLATFPANLLKALPELPEELEYRIVGRDLILRDVTGNVVVDVMRNVFPATS
jgi:hypothetical protein